MAKRPFVLTDMEDRALAACDDTYMEVLVVRMLIERWYVRRIPAAELRRMYERLVSFGLLRVYRKRNGRIRAAKLKGQRIRDLLVRGTAYGRRYLTWKRHVV